MHFPWWFGLLAMLSLILPGTTPALIGFGIGWFISSRKGRAVPARVFKWCAVLLAPFWLAGAGFGAWMLSAMMAGDAENARRHYTVRQATVIDGVDIPAGSMVSRDDDGTLRSVSLPQGATLALSGATWRDGVEFGAHGRVARGTLAVPTVVQDIPCQDGHLVDFRDENHLGSCTLSHDATVHATITDPNGESRVQSFTCQAGAEIELQPQQHGQLHRCTLAAPAEIGGVACAAGAELQLANATLSGCTLARQTRFGAIDLPPGSFIAYYGARPGWFRLPPNTPIVDGFGLSMPGGTEAIYCHHGDALQHLAVDQTAYVTVEGFKLTGSIAFDCGSFQEGTLFEDAVVGGKPRHRGEVVSHDDLASK